MTHLRGMTVWRSSLKQFIVAILWIVYQCSSWIVQCRRYIHLWSGCVRQIAKGMPCRRTFTTMNQILLSQLINCCLVTKLLHKWLLTWTFVGRIHAHRLSAHDGSDREIRGSFHHQSFVALCLGQHFPSNFMRYFWIVYFTTEQCTWSLQFHQISFSSKKLVSLFSSSNWIVSFS